MSQKFFAIIDKRDNHIREVYTTRQQADDWLGWITKKAHEHFEVRELEPIVAPFESAYLHAPIEHEQRAEWAQRILQGIRLDPTRFVERGTAYITSGDTIILATRRGDRVYLYDLQIRGSVSVEGLLPKEEPKKEEPSLDVIANEVVRLIEADISARAGIGNELDGMDNDIRDEMGSKWAGIVKDALKKAEVGA